MRSVIAKYISIVCVCVMVLTAFQSVTVNAEAHFGGGELADQGSEPDNLLGNLEIVRRLTVSDGSASSPSALTLNGTIHIAYASSGVSGMSVLWQRSNDSGDTFTSSLRLTPLFDHISSIKVTGDSLNPGTVAIVFEVQPLGALQSNVYLVCSADGGAHWGRTTLIAEGSNPDAVMFDGDVFVGMGQRISGDDHFSIIRIDLGTSDAVNGSVLLSFPFRPSIVRMAATDGGLAYALVPAGSPGTVIYGSLPFDGEAAAPVPVFSAGKGIVNGLALDVGPSGPCRTTSRSPTISPAKRSAFRHGSGIPDFSGTIIR